MSWPPACASWLLLLALGAQGRAASAAPLLETRVGGLALVGPAIGHPASVFYNPATLTLLPGSHVYLDGTLRLGLGTVALQPIDPQTGAPTGAPGSGKSLRQLFPQLFFTASSDLGFDWVVLALTLHTPFAEHFSFEAGGDGQLFDPERQWAGRTQVVDLTMYSIFLTPSAAIRIFDKLSVGVSFTLAFPFTDFAFVRDAAIEGGLTCGSGSLCGYGSDAAAEAVHVRDQGFGIAFSAGVLVRPHPKLDLGAAYQSGVTARAHEGDAWVRRSQASMTIAAQDPALAAGLTRDLQGRGSVSYALPDMVNVGAAYRATSRLLLDAQFRWIRFSVHDLIDVRLSGPQFSGQPAIPARILHYRGFQDAFAAQLGASFQLTRALTLQGASMVETSAVPAAAESPAAMDSFEIDSFVALRWLIGRGVSLHAGYGLLLMPPRDVQTSAFSPADVVTCVDARYNVDLPACRRAADGQGLASTAGHYDLMIHRFSLGVSYDLW